MPSREETSLGKVRNVLFIMCDQLRADHLSCAGHPHLKTPAIDGLARRGVLFPRAYVQSGVCGPSRMSYYTGRYMFSHGATWNRVPLSLRERTIGDYLLPAGIRVALAGKTHVLPDTDGLERYGIEGGSALAALMRAGRFEELDRYDGHSPPGDESGYAAYLRSHGYNSDDPWSDYVIAANGPDGDKLSGWHMRNVHLPARVAEEHSETAYMTREAMRFVEDMGEQAVVPASQLRQAALALHGARALPRAVRRQGLPAAQSRRVGTFGPASRCWPPTASTRNRFRSSAPRLPARCGRPIWA